MIKTVGILGHGAFGKLWAELFAPYAEVKVLSRRTLAAEDLAANISQVTVEEVGQCDVIFIANELEQLEESCRVLSKYVRPDTIVADVCSVKVMPAEIMERILGDKCRLLVTHPLLGPQSVEANGGTKDMKLVWHELKDGPFPELESLCSDQLGLKILRIDPIAHDKEMAWVHGLTFFVGRGLLQIQPPDSELTTHYYSELMDLVHVERSHSLELFMTIQKGNPFTDDIRKQYVESLRKLEASIMEGKV